MEIFQECNDINNLIKNDEFEARNRLIRLLDHHKQSNVEYTPLLNNLIRQLGLYPYLRVESSSWQDRFIHEAFKVDIGKEIAVTLHKEQSFVLKKLLNGENLAISAPTSFGKSFIIDAFITIKKPKNIVIIVPTIALTDETRRRLQNKFSYKYKIITTSDVELSENNIFVFPQERALNYVNKIETLDMLVIDEFYKADSNFDKERSVSLKNAILKFKKQAKQQYFLAPNISKLKNNPFTEGMEFIEINFNTVFLQEHRLYKSITNEDEKKQALITTLDTVPGKSLIYAGTYTEIDKVLDIILNNSKDKSNEKNVLFSKWLSDNYSSQWPLVEAVKNNTGIHNGRLHRSLSQIQIKLFEDDDGLKNIVSTSSIIEGVNTSAKNVILWKNKNGQFNLNYFSYKNLIGRGGRMLKHFIGDIYIFDKPPEEQEIQLSLDMPNELVDERQIPSDIDEKHRSSIIEFHQAMAELLGNGFYNELKKDGFFENNNWEFINDLTIDMTENPASWNGLNNLNANNVSEWDRFLYKIKKLAKIKGKHKEFVEFTKISSQSWNKTIPVLINELSIHSMGLNEFFEQEKKVTFGLSNALSCVNTLQKILLPNIQADISPFVVKTSHAFLPANVYFLEEYGLPRMIAKKIHLSQLLDLENNKIELHTVISQFNKIGYEQIITKVREIGEFDKYILKYFFDGIESQYYRNSN